MLARTAAISMAYETGTDYISASQPPAQRSSKAERKQRQSEGKAHQHSTKRQLERREERVRQPTSVFNLLHGFINATEGCFVASIEQALCFRSHSSLGEHGFVA